MRNSAKHIGLLLIALLLTVLPAAAQPEGMMMSFELFMADDPSPASLETGAGRTGSIKFDGVDGEVTLEAIAHCLGGDPACAAEGQSFTVTLGGLTGRFQPDSPTYMTYTLENVLISSYSSGGVEVGPFSLNGRGSLACADEACATLTAQAAACGMAGERRVGLALRGTLAADQTLPAMFQTPGNYPLDWQNLSGTLVVTGPETANPICTRRGVGDLFEAEYTPEASDLTEEERAIIPPVKGGGEQIIDRRIVIEFTSAGLRDMEIIFHARGSFFGQCGVAPQVRVGDDINPVHVLIYRVIPEGTTCTGGLESFQVEIPLPLPASLQVGDRFRANINGQIIAILIG